MSLSLIIQKAYNLRPWLLLGPAWLGDDKWDIVAKIPQGATKEEVDLMLQNLLAERFGLVAHREIRPSPIYELAVANDGPKLTEAEDPPGGVKYGPSSGVPVRLATLPRDKDGWPVLPPGSKGVFPSMSGGNFRWEFRIQPISEFVAFLERELSARDKRPVVDKTGLAGTYRFQVTFGSDDPRDMRAAGLPEGASSDLRPRLDDAINKLGLRLVSSKGPVGVLVVDHVNRTATEN